MKLIKEILEKGEIKSLSIESGMGVTGEARSAKYKDKKYLLRICKDEETAKKYMRFYKRFHKYGFLPKLLEYEGKYMLFEFIEGKMCNEKESPKIIYQVGKICSIINKYKAEYSYKRERSFFEKLQEIKDKKIISEELAKKVENIYSNLDKKVKLKISLDAGDVTKDNFMIDKKGKIYFVDIEAIKATIKGMGIAKSFSSWFKTPKEQENFKKGYNSVSSMKFYTPDYAKFVTLIFFIQRIRFKSNKGEMNIVNKTINKLEKLVKKEI